jgi:predicted GTPase
MKRTKVIIMGAAGRDFHNFNIFYRDNESYEVIAFTAAQIPNIEGRKYPALLCGKLYPEGINIYPENDLVPLIKEYGIDEVVFAYSDVSYSYVMQRAATIMAAGAGFSLMGPEKTMIKSRKPVISICAVRTGSGKSQTTRKVNKILRAAEKNTVVVRHPMPYGNLLAQKIQRYSSLVDLDKYNCTIEEREEYEPHIESGTVVYSGIDYGKILKEAEKEADIILWDGGNNDLPFYKPDLHIVIVDPHRPGDELCYYPGEANLRMADVVIINKVDTAKKKDILAVRKNVSHVNQKALVINAASPIMIEGWQKIKNKNVLVIEDGPTLTHGNMLYGAGVLAARKYGAKKLIDPSPFAVGSIVQILKNYPRLKNLLPAMGYNKEQMNELETTINNADADLVIIGTPVDLSKILKINKPVVRVHYSLQEIGKPDLNDALIKFI